MSSIFWELLLKTDITIIVDINWNQSWTKQNETENETENKTDNKTENESDNKIAFRVSCMHPRQVCYAQDETFFVQFFAVHLFEEEEKTQDDTFKENVGQIVWLKWRFYVDFYDDTLLSAALLWNHLLCHTHRW